MNKLTILFVFAGMACSNAPKKQPENTLHRDSLTVEAPVENRPMMIRLSMTDFVNGFGDIPFPFNDSLLKVLRVQSLTYTESTRTEGEWINHRSSHTWEFNTEGQRQHYLFTEDNATQKVHEETFTYSNGRLTESAFTNHLWGPQPVITRYTYTQGLLTRAVSTDQQKQVSGDLAYTYSGTALKTMKDWSNGIEYKYEYAGGKLTRVTMAARNWGKNYAYNENGMPSELRSVTNYNDYYTFLYNKAGQLEQIHWEEDEKPLADIYFEFESNGLLKTIRHIGHVAALHDERKLEFTYTFYP